MNTKTKKATKKAVVKKEKKTADGLPKHTFTLDTLTLKNGFWALRMKVDTILDRSYRTYFVQLIFNNETYANRVESLINRRTAVEAEPALINDLRDEKVRRINTQIEETKAEWESKRNECPTIEFHATVSSIKWSGGKTQIDMGVPDAVVNDFNNKKTLMPYYVAAFEPDKK